MTPGNGTQPPDNADKSLGEIVSEVSEKASLLVREEIELAKAEIQQKVGRLTKGAAVGIAAGTFAFFAFVIFLHALSWFWVDLFDLSQAGWASASTAALLLLLGVARRPPRLPLHQARLAADPGPSHRAGQADPRGARAPDDRARPAREGAHLTETRSPDEIRHSIESTRQELAFSVNDLRSKVGELTNWRRQLVGESPGRAGRGGRRRLCDRRRRGRHLQPAAPPAPRLDPVGPRPRARPQ